MAKIVLIDNGHAFIRALFTSFNEGGHDAKLIAPKAEELTAISQESPDLILVDPVLSDADGTLYALRVRQIVGRVPIVFLPNPSANRHATAALAAKIQSPMIADPDAPLNAFRAQIENILRLLDTRVATTSLAPSTPNVASVQARVIELESEFAAAIPNKVDALRQALAAARDHPERRAEAVSLAHRLRGTAGSYGFAGLGTTVGQIEDALLALVGANANEEASIWQGLDQANARLEELRSSVSHKARVSTLPPSPFASATLLIVDRDAEFCDLVRRLAEKRLVHVATATDANTAFEIAHTHTVLAAIIDVGIEANDSSAFLGLAARMRALPELERLPLVFSSTNQSLEMRVAAAQIGGSVFLEKPASEDAVSAVLQHILTQATEPKARVLVVDDDPDFAHHAVRLLSATGIDAKVTEDPATVPSLLETWAPDLVMLDVQLPQVSGYDVCRALRASPQWQLLPILMVTAHAYEEARVEAFRAGATDLISKPLLPEELDARVASRLLQARLFRERSERDNLTGLLLRRTFLEGFERMMSLARRESHTIAVVILDIDLFKHINDDYGHLVGDTILASLGQLIRQRFRTEDLRCRWGGEEFCLAFPNTNGSFAALALQRLLAEFAAIRFQSEDGRAFHASFTAGVATFPEDGADLRALVAQADARMYRGKRAGRNRVIGPLDDSPKASTSPLRVLLIDDESDIRKIGQLSLQMVGRWKADLAASGTEGIECARRAAPDVILLDVMMPGMDGLETLHKIQADPKLKSIPVIFMTANVQSEDIEDYIKRGAKGVIEKPFDPLTLPAKITATLSA